VFALIIIIIGSCFSYLEHRENVAQDKFEASLTADDLGHIDSIIKKIKVAKKGDVIIYNNGTTAMIWWVSTVRGEVRVKYRPLQPLYRDILFSHRSEFLTMKDVMPKSKAIDWAPLAQKLFELDR
jgi:hypothetical protein